MLTPEIIATREKTLAAHLDGETRKDVDSVLATFSGVPTYDLVTVGTVISGHDEVRGFPQLFFDSVGPNTPLAERCYHLEVRTVGIFPFDGDQMLAEKLYADVSPLVPFMPWLVEA